jgi:hypothetical protein
MTGYGFAIGLVVVVLVTIIQLLRTRRLREKYATAWIVVAVVIAVLGLFPQLLVRVAQLVGVATPINVLFALGGVVLLVVCIQYSVEISALEAETRTLAEHAALLAHQVRELAERVETLAPAPSIQPTSSPSEQQEPNGV